MFNLSREREDIMSPLCHTRRSHNSFPFHRTKEFPKDELALTSSIQEKDYEVDVSRSIDPSMPTPRTPWMQQTEASLGSPAFSAILEHDRHTPWATSTDIPFTGLNQFSRSHLVDPLPNCCPATHNSLEPGHSAPCPVIAPPLVPSSYSSDDEPPESTGPRTPKQNPESYHIVNASKRANCVQTAGHTWHPDLSVQEPTHYDTFDNVLCCCDDCIDSEVSFRRSGPHIDIAELQTTDAPATTPSLARVVMTRQTEASCRLLDGALARLDASLNRERRQRSRDGLPVEGTSNISFVGRLIPRKLLNMESGKFSWIGNVYRQATEWTLNVRIFLKFAIASNRQVFVNR
jgi:hypothetical protein